MVGIVDVYDQAINVSNPYDTTSGITCMLDPSKGQGNISNIRHGVGTALGRDVISGWLDPSSIETGDPNLIARTIGTGGAWLGGVGQEIADAWRSYRKGTPNWYIQPWEDILANTMGLRKTDYYTSPKTKALNLAGAYATDSGIMNTALQNLSKDSPGAITQKDLQLSIMNKGTGETGKNVHPNRMAKRRDTNPNRGFIKTKYGKSYRRGGIASLWLK